MLKLLRAELSRMWRSKLFWACALITFMSTGIITYIIVFASSIPVEAIDWDSQILANSRVSLFGSAAFAALFIGTDYSDGTIRCKIMVGRTRVQICLANLFTVMIGSVVIAAAGALPAAAVAAYCGKACFSMSAGDFALGAAVCLCAHLSSSALVTLIAMLIASRSAAVTLSLVLMTGMYAGCAAIHAKLSIPLSYIVTPYDENGEPGTPYEEANPEAVTGTARVALETLYNTLPFGEISQSRDIEAARGLLPLNAFELTAVSAAVCIGVFRKKDLK